MRRAILAALTASGLAALFAAPAEAVGTRYPFCIQGDEYPGLSNCTFTSYQQCQATASGRFLTCIANPYFVGETEPQSAGCLSAAIRRCLNATRRPRAARRNASSIPIGQMRIRIGQYAGAAFTERCSD